MAKTRRLEKPAKLEEILEEQPKKQKLPIEDMPLNTITDYVRYNREARRLNKELKIARYPIKQCPIELHPKETVVFNRKKQATNPLPVYLSNDMIEFKQTLIPGKTYELPRCVVEFLAKKGDPIWDWVVKPDGSKETQKVSMDPRFALRTVYKD